MSEAKHISLDLETIGVGPRAGVLAIGAKAFDPLLEWPVEHTGNPGKDLYINVDLEAQFANAAKGAVDSSDISALYWWLSQKDEAQSALCKNLVDPTEAAERFRTFVLYDVGVEGHCRNSKDVYIWGNGNMFDNVILRNLFKGVGVEYPAHFMNDMDMRTLKQAAYVSGHRFERPKLVGTHHNALDDAIYQAEYIRRMHQAIAGRTDTI
jgi:hypothetical protein